ncbi:MAG: choice-of-anchor D domain-containing protein [Bryobacterales bacterium]|nr:choice-of-anchor D domain-containing protein [Bryobacterales bacterium]
MKAKLLFLSLILASMAVIHGQVLIRVQQGNNIVPIPNGGSVTVNSTGVAQPRTLQVTVTYIGSTTLTFPQAPEILGSQDFSITRAPATYTVLAPNQSLTIDLQYLPSSELLAQSEMDFGFLQSAPVPTIPGQTAQPPTPGIIAIGLNGTTPEYSLSYGLALDGNIVNVSPGGTLVFTDTPVNGSTAATMFVLNRGSGAGQIQSVTVAGDAYSLISMPLLPSVLAAGANFQFQVRYRPRQTGTDTGTLNVTFEGGRSYAINLSGRGIASYLTYELLTADGATQPIAPNQVVAVPAVTVGSKSTVFIKMRNSSNLDITVPSVAIAGTAFQISDLPFLPVTMAPGDIQFFTLIFSPPAAGKQTGKLRVGNDSFDLAGEGIGPLLTYSYRSPAGVTPVQPLGGVIFPGVQVGDSSSIDFTIKNTGSAPAPIISVGIVSDGKAVFTLAGLPALPTAIAPDGSVTFSVKFSPLNTNLSSASLRINTEAFTLAGIGSTPQPLPEFTLQGPTSVQPFQQPSVSLTLASSYPVALTGTLTLTTESEVAASDPSVQFVTGNRVAAFTIPAGTTKAVFASGSTQIKFQTGSLASTIVLTPAFATQGGLDMTPERPTVLRAGLPATAPQLVSASVDSRTSNGFTVALVGYTTTKSLTKANISFKGKPGYNFPQTDFSVDLTASSFVWFTSASSLPYGGQFLMQMPFSISNSDTSSSALPPIQAIESVTVTLTNGVGTSNSLTALVQ